MPPPDVPCLSIRQPWAWLIAAGHKPVENRTWATAYRGAILLHAGRQMANDEDVANDAMQVLGVQRPAGYPLGGIVGVALLTDCVMEHKSEWFEGPYAFVLAQARPLPFRALPGKLGIFRVQPTPEEAEAFRALTG